MNKNFTSEEIINYIAKSKKVTPVKVYIKGNLEKISFPEEVKNFGDNSSKVIFADMKTWEQILINFCHIIKDYLWLHKL